MSTGAPDTERPVRERVARPGRRMRRVCAGTPVHHEQTVRLSFHGNWWKAGEEEAASVCGYTGTPRANSQPELEQELVSDRSDRGGARRS